MPRPATLLLLLLPLAGCAGGPGTLGITGPQGSASGVHPTAAPAQDPLDNPNVLQSGVRYGPSPAPTTGGGRFWGYD